VTGGDLADRFNAAECRGCSQSIVWARTDNDKSMPLDPLPVAGGNVKVTGVGRDDRGVHPRVRVLGKRESESLLDPPGEHRYVTHFVTCPKRKDFKR